MATSPMEATVAPCASVRGSLDKVENINTVTEGSNRLTLKHWSTFKALYAPIESVYVVSPSVLVTSPSGDSSSITRVERVDLPDT